MSEIFPINGLSTIGNANQFTKSFLLCFLPEAQVFKPQARPSLFTPREKLFSSIGVKIKRETKMFSLIQECTVES